MVNQELYPTEKSPKIVSLFLIIAIVSLALAAIFVKLSEEEINPNAVIFHRSWIATIIFGLWKHFRTSNQQTSEEQNIQSESDKNPILWLLLGVGVCSLATQYCWVWSLTQTGAANATLLRNFTPVFTILAGWLLLKRQFNNKFLLGAAIAIGGVAVMGFNDWQVSSDVLQGDLLALFCAAFYSGTLLMVEHLRTKLDVTTILLWRCAVGTVLTIPTLFIDIHRIFPYSMGGWLAVIALTVVCQVLGQGMLYYCLKRLSASFVSITLLTEPIITAYFAWLFFSETLSFRKVVAFAAVLLGIYLAKSSSLAVNNE